MINVKLAGMTGEPSAAAESETAILQSIIDIAKNDSVLYFPEGTYNLNTVTVVGKTLSFVSDRNALIVQHANAPVFDLKGGWEREAAVTGLQTAEIDFTLGGNQPTRVTVLTLDGDAQEAGFRAGDIVKIYADDVIPGSKTGERPGTARRVGEFSQVLRIEENRVMLNRVLRENYTTRIRLTKFNGHRFRLEGLRFDTLDRGDDEGWNREYISIKACPELRISDLHCRRGWGSFIKLVGCFAYRIDNIAVYNLKNRADQGIYGYGVNDFSSHGGFVHRSLFVNCRHGYTTNTSALPAGDDQIEYYGRTAYIVVSDCQGLACSNAAFDTHDDAWNVQFNHCVAQGAYRGNSALGVGFSARGQHIYFHHCTAEGCNVGFSSTEAYPGSSADHVFTDCKALACTALAAEMKRIASGERVRGVRFERCHLESSGEYVLNFRNSDITMNNTSVRSLNDTEASAKLINLESSALHLHDCRFLFEGPRPDDNPKFFRIVGESSVNAAHIRVLHPRHEIERIAESPSANDSPLVMEDLVFRVLPRYAPYNLANYRFAARSTEDGAATAYIKLPITAANSAAISAIGHSADPLIVADLIPGGNVSIADLPPGFQPMQRLILRNRPDAANAEIVLTIEGQAMQLMPGGRIGLVWNGQEWIRID